MTDRQRRGAAGVTPLETTIVIIIAGVTLSILMPAVGVMRQRALGTRCQQHLRALGVAGGIYMSDYVGENWLPASELPGGPYWFQKIAPYVGGRDTGTWRETFVCPRARQSQRGFDRGTLSFGWNEQFLPFRTLSSQVLNPDETAAIADSLAGPESDTVLTAAGELRLDPRHRGRANLLFLSGNVCAMSLQEVRLDWPRYWDRE